MSCLFYSIEANATEEFEEELERPYQALVIVTVCAVILSFAADLITLFLLIWFKTFKKQHYNTFILHHTIMNLLNLLWVVLLLIAIHYKEYSLIEFFLDSIFTMLFAENYLFVFMTIDWYVFTFVPSKSTSFRQQTRLILAIIYAYVSVITLYLLIMDYFLNFTVVLSLLHISLSFISAPVIVLVFGGIYLRKKHRSLRKIDFFVSKLATLKYCVCIAPVCVSLCIAIYRSDFADYIAVCFAVLARLYPVVQIFALYFWNHRYKAALIVVFGCKCFEEGIGDCLDEEEAENECRVVFCD